MRQAVTGTSHRGWYPVESTWWNEPWGWVPWRVTRRDLFHRKTAALMTFLIYEKDYPFVEGEVIVLVLGLLPFLLLFLLLIIYLSELCSTWNDDSVWNFKICSLLFWYQVFFQTYPKALCYFYTIWWLWLFHGVFCRIDVNMLHFRCHHLEIITYRITGA